jgi:soluble lytic murein transglycosylase-like protein
MNALPNLAGLFSLMRALLALTGLVAVTTVAWPWAREGLLQHVMAIAAAAERPESSAVAIAPMPLSGAAGSDAPDGAAELTPEQGAVARFIARRYRVAEQASRSFVRTAYQAGTELAVDPLLILAVMAVESSYNPVARSSMGALGLMQVIPRYHPEKLEDHGGGEEALLDPEINIRVGTLVLQEYLRRFRELEPALQKYAGAFDEPTARYAGKVLAEKARLQRLRAHPGREA